MESTRNRRIPCPAGMAALTLALAISLGGANVARGQGAGRLAAILELPRDENVTFDHKTIIEECSRALAHRDRLEPKELALALRQRAAALVWLRDFKRALKDYDDLVLLRPKDDTVRRNRATALWSLNRRDEAVADIQEALRLNAKSSDNHIALGLVLLEAGGKKEALGTFDKAVMLDGKNGYAYYYRGLYYAGIEVNFERALRDLDRFLDLLPHLAADVSRSPYLYRGLALQGLNRSREALASLLMARRLKATDPQIAAALAAVYVELDKVHLAAHHAEEAVRLGPKEESALNIAAITNARLGRRERAWELAERAEKVVGNNPEGYASLAGVEFEVGRYEKAHGYYVKAFDAAPDYEALVGRASFLASCPDAKYRDGHSATGLAVTAHLLKDIAPYSRWRSAIAAAEAYAETGNFARAVEYAKEAIEIAGPELGCRPQLLDKLALFEKKLPYRAPDRR